MKGRLIRAVPLLLVLALAAWVRLAHVQSAIVEGALVPQVDGDSSYHLTRTLRTIQQFPRVPHFDPEMNWPKGAAIPWGDGFDLGGAAFALALGGGRDGERARFAIALWPVLLGVLTVWAAMRLAASVAPGRSGRGVVLATGVIAGLVPEGIYHSLFARIDHHVFEALVMALLATWALRRVPVRRGIEAPSPGRTALRFEIEGALLSAVAVYGFTGSPIYVLVAVVPLAWAAFRDGRLLGSGAAALLAGGLLSAALTLPAVTEHHRWWSFQLPSMLQPLQLVLAGAGLAVLAWCGRGGARRWRRVGLAVLGAGAVGAAAVAWAVPAVEEVRAAITGWILHRDPWLATVREFSPLLRTDSTDVGWVRVYNLLGWAGFFFPFALLFALRAARRSPRVAHLLAIAVALLGLTLLQNRFDRVLVPVLAVVLALVLVHVLRVVALRVPAVQPAALAPLVALALFVADPPSRAMMTPRHAGPTEPWIEAALDLRRAPPPASGDRGVLTNWWYGHHLQALAGVPVVTNGFGSYLDAPEFWKSISSFQLPAAEFDAYLASHRIGVVVAGAATVGNEITGASDAPTFSNRALDAAYMSGSSLSPLLIAGSGVPDWNVPHLPHLMPRFASQGVVADLAFPLPYLWGWERVPGAEVHGRAPPGARVVAELAFAENGRPHRYRAWTDAAPDGAWTLTLPMPSGLVRPTLRAAAAWHVAANGGAPVRFTVPEQAVRRGDVIDAGLVPGPAQRPEAPNLAASAR